MSLSSIQGTRRDIQIVEYDKRFINNQKWFWDGEKLQILHPLCSTELSDLNDNFIEKNHQFTPKDSALLWEKLEEVFTDEDKEEIIEDLSPDNVFQESSILTLDDTRDYEDMIKKNIQLQLAMKQERVIKVNIV